MFTEFLAGAKNDVPSSETRKLDSRIKRIDRRQYI